MYRKHCQSAAWLTAISIAAAGLLSAVHVHAPGESCGSHSHSGKLVGHSHAHKHCGASSSHCHLPDPTTPGENELPFLPGHDSDACVICQFAGDSGNLTILPLTTGSLEISQSVVIRPNRWTLLEDAFVYQGRGPPVIFSI
jgi:hypothetical protein